MLNDSHDQNEGVWRSGDGGGKLLSDPRSPLRLGRDKKRRKKKCQDNRWDEQHVAIYIHIYQAPDTVFEYHSCVAGMH